MKEDIVLKRLMNQIIAVTGIIQVEFPEFYLYLSETPLFLANNQKRIKHNDFERYYDFLKTQLALFKGQAKS